MTDWLSRTEIEMEVREKLERGKRERIHLTPNRGRKSNSLVHKLLSLIF